MEHHSLRGLMVWLSSSGGTGKTPSQSSPISGKARPYHQRLCCCPMQAVLGCAEPTQVFSKTPFPNLLAKGFELFDLLRIGCDYNSRYVELRTEALSYQHAGDVAGTQVVVC